MRLALGARASAIRRMILVEGLRPVLVGLAVGLATAAAATDVLGSLLYGVEALDAPTFAAWAIVLLAVAATACALPAWRAARIDPATTLRAE